MSYLHTYVPSWREKCRPSSQLPGCLFALCPHPTIHACTCQPSSNHASFPPITRPKFEFSNLHQSSFLLIHSASPPLPPCTRREEGCLHDVHSQVHPDPCMALEAATQHWWHSQTPLLLKQDQATSKATSMPNQCPLSMMTCTLSDRQYIRQPHKVLKQLTRFWPPTHPPTYQVVCAQPCILYLT